MKRMLVPRDGSAGSLSPGQRPALTESIVAAANSPPEHTDVKISPEATAESTRRIAEYVIFVHGIGRQRRDSFTHFGHQIECQYKRALVELGRTSGILHWKTVFWSDLTEPAETEFEASLPGSGLFHHFIIQYVADAVAYAARHHWPGMNEKIQSRFDQALEDIGELIQRSGETSGNLTVIGHSIGTLIALDSLEAAFQKQSMPAGVELKRLVTLGSPVSLYASLFGLRDVMGRSRPAVWMNLYYPQDPIGYPLMKLRGARGRAVRDIALSPRRGMGFLRGGARALLSRIPIVGPILSHSWYFTDDEVAYNVGQLLAGRWDAQCSGTTGTLGTGAAERKPVSAVSKNGTAMILPGYPGSSLK